MTEDEHNDMTHEEHDPEEQPVEDKVVLPALLRAARNTYAAAIRRALAAAECDDIPRNGVYVLGAIARSGAPISQIITDLDVSKQAVGQLIDTLVLRGYLTREVDAEDRRRLAMTLTERGQAAALATKAAVESVEAELLQRVGAEVVAHTRAALHTLADMRHEMAR